MIIERKELKTVEVVFYRENQTILAVQVVRTWSFGLAYSAAFNILSRDFPQTCEAIQNECVSFSAAIKKGI